MGATGHWFPTIGTREGSAKNGFARCCLLGETMVMAVHIPNFKGLIERCFGGPDQDQAIEDLCTAIRPYLLVMLISLSPTNPAVAEDALQNAFVKMIQLFKGTKRPVPIITEGYLATIAKHCLLDELRRQEHHVNIDDLMEQGIRSTEANKEDAEPISEEIILLALNRLDAKCQFILESYYIRNIGVSELAKRLDISPASVYMTMKRCRDRLREILSPYLSSVGR
jgi:RNA polymerase sigma factor (sigma-70 family)